MTVRIVLAVFFLAVSTAAARAASLVPFEALYSIDVSNWKMAGAMQGFTGSQIVRIEKSCTDWSLTARFELVAQAEGGRSLAFETEVNGGEAIDGTRYRFRTETRLRGETLTRLAGAVTRAAPGQPGHIIFTEPEARTVSLPPEVLFPGAAAVWALRQWERGEKTANYVLFDGTLPEPVRVFELLTGNPPRLDPLPEGDTRLLEARAWRSTGSFHSYAGKDSQPLTTLTQTVLGNGVATELVLDIGIADVNLRLRRIRALAEPKC